MKPKAKKQIVVDISRLDPAIAAHLTKHLSGLDVLRVVTAFDHIEERFHDTDQESWECAQAFAHYLNLLLLRAEKIAKAERRKWVKERGV